MKNSKKRIHIAFIGKPQWEAGWPYMGYDNETMIKSIMSELQNRYPQINFSINSMITPHDEEAIKTNQDSIQNVDACIFFTIGHYGDPNLIDSALQVIRFKRIPMVLANFVYMGDHTFLKIITSIREDDLPLVAVSSKVIEDFSEHLDVLVNILEMKGKRALVYATDDPNVNWNTIFELHNPEMERIAEGHPEFFQRIKSMKDTEGDFFTDHEGQDQAHQWRRNEELYEEQLRSVFGMKMVRENPEDILNYYNQVSDEQAKDIASKWVKNATKVVPSEKTILNAAKLYVALKQLLVDKNYDIFAPDCGTLLLTGRMPAFPCLPFFELVNDQKYGICESDMDCLVSFLFGLVLTNRPGFTSNHTFDSVRNQITYLHCICSNKLHGQDGINSEYEIRYHGESAILGASPCVKFPVGEILTTIKISVFEKKIAIRTGKIVDNIDDQKACVTKVLVESDVQKILDKYDWTGFGWHRVSFLGDWRNQFIIGAKLLGLEVFEEDK